MGCLDKESLGSGDPLMPRHSALSAAAVAALVAALLLLWFEDVGPGCGSR